MTAGYSLLELLLAVGTAVTVTAVAIPQLSLTVDDVRAEGAARFLTARLQQVRMEAIKRSMDVGLQFAATPDGYTYSAYLDGNGNGISTVDIQRGVDVPLGAPESLRDHFANVDFGVMPGLPGVDPGSPPPDNDPIKLGPGNILTFTPLGSSSTGSVYLQGRRNLQYVIRVIGETGKARVLRFSPRTRRWLPL